MDTDNPLQALPLLILLGNGGTEGLCAKLIKMLTNARKQFDNPAKFKMLRIMQLIYDEASTS